MLSDFSTTLSAKWILTGEHAVVRQHPAIIYPLPHFQLSMSYQVTDKPWQVSVLGKYHAALQSLFFSTLEHALTLTDTKEIDRRGSFFIHNAIPLGSGLGASGAFCAAISQWLASQGLIEIGNINKHATQLENIFHGKSSGLDIIGTSAKTGRYFHNGKNDAIQQLWQPHWYLSYSGTQCKTDQCINQVSSIWQKDAFLAQSIDEQMAESVKMALAALNRTDNGLSLLAESINLAKSCFQQWGLINPQLHNHMQTLTNAGAIACKPTGSGGGGYVISLWPQPAPVLDSPMIPLQLNTINSEIYPTKEYAHYD